MFTAFHLLPIAALVAYICAAAAYLNQLSDSPSISTSTARRWLIAGFLMHVLFFVLEQGVWKVFHLELFVEAARTPAFPTTLSLICALVVGTFLLLEQRFGVTLLGAVLAPLAALMMFIAGLLFHVTRDGAQPIESNLLVAVHVGLTILGHAAFVVAFATSVCLIVQESYLKRRKLSSLQRKLPSLAVLDRLNARFLWSGFFLMFGGVLLGCYFALKNNVQLLLLDSRIAWSFITLSVYAGLLLAMLFWGYRGRRAAWLSVFGFGTVVASFVGLNWWGSGFHVY